MLESNIIVVAVVFLKEFILSLALKGIFTGGIAHNLVHIGNIIALGIVDADPIIFEVAAAFLILKSYPAQP